MELYLATSKGVIVANVSEGEWEVTGTGLNGRHVTSIIAREGVILAGTEDGLFRSDNRGRTWREASDGLSQRHVRWLAYHPDVSDLEFAGTEPAAIFVSRDGGESWQERPEVAELREELGWWLPYSPEAGCVRGFAFNGERAYAAVEVGGLLRTDDSGATWGLAPGSDGQPRFGRPADGFVHPDVHSVNVHPSSADLIFAPTGGGFYVSEDGGETWEGRYVDCYVRAVWVDPADAAHLILGPSEGPSGREGRIEESHDGGRNWRPLTKRWASNMVERFSQVGDLLLAVMAGGDVFQATQSDLAQWRRVPTDVEGVNAITAMA